MELLHDNDGMEKLWTVERFNLRQIKMETVQQVRMHVRNLLEAAEDYRRTLTFLIQKLNGPVHVTRLN